MPGDLHTHSNFSDGSSEIELLPFLARRAGLSHLAVCDHDTLKAVEYAETHPVVQGVTLLPGVELTAYDRLRDRRVHLLCYCPQKTPELAAFCELMSRRRNEATAQSIAQLEVFYPQFTRAAAKAFSARSGVTYKTHLIRLLYEYGYTDGIYKELYGELFGKNGKVLHDPAYEPWQTVLPLIRQAGGVAVFAHPSVYQSMELVVQFAEAGLIDGVEIDQPRNSEADKAALRALAQKHDLLVTGGSDFHGMHMSRPVPVGSFLTGDANVSRILALAKMRKS